MVKRRAAILTAVILAACGPASPAAPTPGTLAPAVSPTSPPASPSTGPSPSAKPLASPPVGFYHLRLEFSTTSDWSTLQLLHPESVLAIRLVETSGGPTALEAGLAQLSLNQPLAAAEAVERVGMTVDYALDAAAAGQTLDFRLEKGALNGSVIRLSLVEGDQETLIEEVRHRIVVPGNPGRNPLEICFSLRSLQPVAASVVVQDRVETPRLLWAFYYPWYASGDWSSPMLSDHPLVPYDSADEGTILRHIEQAQEAGIDGFISSWWGPGSDTDQALGTLLDLAAERGFWVTIYFETLTEEGGRDSREILAWLSYAIETYRDHPAFLRVDGKPLIVLWASATVPLDSWDEILGLLRQRGLDAVYLGMGYSVANLEVFDGLHEYGVFTIPDLAQVEASTGRAVHAYSLLAPGDMPKIWAATVQPGYDDRLIPGREGLLQERNQGQFYRDTFEAAIASDPDWIFITSWNEWWEHTHIEPSEHNGELYLDITREYARQWKGE
jgi:hypothetical protein